MTGLFAIPPLQIEVIPWEQAIQGGIGIMALIVVILFIVFGIVVGLPMVSILRQLTEQAKDAKDDAEAAITKATASENSAHDDRKETMRTQKEMVVELRSQTELMRVNQQSAEAQVKAYQDLSVQVVAGMTHLKDDFRSALIDAREVAVADITETLHGHNTLLMKELAEIRQQMEKLTKDYENQSHDRRFMADLKTQLDSILDQIRKIVPGGTTQ